MGKIRIIGGKWRGRKISVLTGHESHPTKNCVRETLFNWLTPYIVGASCLDCFSGSGALGLEALSRYARSATFLEIKFDIVKQLQQTIAMLKTSKARVINTNTLFYLTQYGTPYNIVFVDPPFHKDLLEDTLNLLDQKGWIASDSFIYVESAARGDIAQIPIGWNLYREKTSGFVQYRLYRFKI